MAPTVAATPVPRSRLWLLPEPGGGGLGAQRGAGGEHAGGDGGGAGRPGDAAGQAAAALAVAGVVELGLEGGLGLGVGRVPAWGRPPAASRLASTSAMVVMAAAPMAVATRALPYLPRPGVTGSTSRLSVSGASRLPTPMASQAMVSSFV